MVDVTLILDTTSKQRSRSFILVPIDFWYTTFQAVCVYAVDIGHLYAKTLCCNKSSDQGASTRQATSRCRRPFSESVLTVREDGRRSRKTRAQACSAATTDSLRVGTADVQQQPVCSLSSERWQNYRYASQYHAHIISRLLVCLRCILSVHRRITTITATRKKIEKKRRKFVKITKPLN